MSAHDIHLRIQNKRNHFNISIDEHIPGAGITILYGPSGAGKTSVLRSIAGLDKASSCITLNNHAIGRTPAHKRPIAYVQQRPFLFPHKTVQQNLAYAHKRRLDASGISVDEVIELLALAPLLTRPSHQLSGGERQRAAIAQALLRQPTLLLLDEPLSSLDHQQQHQLLDYLDALKHRLAIPVIYVTHSLQELARLGDYLLLINAGTIVARGALPDAFGLLEQVTDHREISCLIEGHIAHDETAQQWGLDKFVFDGGTLWLSEARKVASETHGIVGHKGKAARVRLFAKDISLARSKHTDMSVLNILPGTITHIACHAALAIVHVRLDHSPHTLIASITKRSLHQLQLTVGEPIWAQIKSAALAL